VVQFPGSNCDDDAYHAIGSILGQPVDFIWHQSENISGFDAVILPGGLPLVIICVRAPLRVFLQ
jgi:phosphoribosylformylglycinamidine (FGAM) synthase-like amidotransferase family enzyme